MEAEQFKFTEDLDHTTFFCGLDVHKYQLTVAIHGKSDVPEPFTKQAIFSTDPRGLREFWSFISRFKPVKIAMEATNVYHHVVATFLEDTAMVSGWKYDVLVIATGDATGMPGRQKNDKADARDIARYLSADLLREARPVVTPMEDLRAIFRGAARMEVEMTALKNRIKKSMDRGGFRPRNFVLNHQWSRDLVYHLSGHEGTVGDFLAGIGKDGHPMHAKRHVLVKNMPELGLYGEITLSPGQKAMMRQDVVELEFKMARKALIAVEIDHIISLRPGLRQVISNLAGIPGISPYSAAWLVAEVGSAARYPSIRHFLAYAGCGPRVVESAGKIYSTHVSRKSNKHARYIFRQAAKVLCDTVKKESALKAYATRTKTRKGSRGSRLVYSIVSAKIARVVYGIMKNGTSFHPNLACKKETLIQQTKKPLFVTDRKVIRKARNYLRRVSRIPELQSITANARYFADALDEALKEN